MDAEKQNDMDRIEHILMTSQRVALQDLRNVLTGYSEPTVNVMIWRAREHVFKEHGIEFGPMIGAPDHIERCDTIRTAKRGVRRIAKGHRSERRGVARLRVAAAQSTDAKERERLERIAEREEERQNFRKRREV